MRPMNAQAVNALAQRFADTDCARPPADPTDRAPADPADSVRQVDVSLGTSCTPEEFQAIAAATRQEFLVKLDRWRNEKTAVQTRKRQNKNERDQKRPSSN